jgi:hypothetical protein
VAPNLPEQALSRLHADGVLVIGLPQSKKAYRRTTVRIGVATQTLLDDERGD